MQAEFQMNGAKGLVDISQPMDISVAISDRGPRAWYVNPPVIEPVRENGFVGSVAEGGAVNFRNISFNPHGHGTHTECLGHISPQVESINQNVNDFFHWCVLLSVKPEKEGVDEVITSAMLKKVEIPPFVNALVIRTLPNSKEKTEKVYSSTNPPYLKTDAVEWMVEQGIEHLLLDVPSVDREEDGGALAGHRAFWRYPENPRKSCTITEFIYAPDSVKDGLYLLNLQIAAFENDAAPSRPVLYAVSNLIIP